MMQHTSNLPYMLTRRQREVLILVGRGMTNAQISKHLGISKLTVQNHLHTIFIKLGVDTRTKAAVLAVQSGLLDLVLEE